MTKVAVVAQHGLPDVPAEIIQQSIVELAAGMKTLTNSRLKHETIVTLLHASSGVGKREIRCILGHLNNLENEYLKPKDKK